MAGDWIKFEANTPEKPEVFAITATMGWSDPDLTVGKLLKVWRWFDQQTMDGNAVSVTLPLLDCIAGVIGFANAMLKVGWLEVSDVGVSLPNFERHNGKTAKQRCLGAKRAASHKSNAKGNGKSNANSVTSALPREEKRREENKDKGAGAQQLPGLNFDIRSELSARGVDDQVAADWLQMRKSQKAPVTETVLKQHIEEADKARLSLGKALAYAISRNWRGFKAEWYAGAGNGVASGSLSSEQPVKIPKREIVW